MTPNISLIQMDIHIKDVDYNFRQMEKLMIKAMNKHPDILVLPETWNTGFFTGSELSALSDPDGKRAKAFLSTFAKEYHVNIVGGSVAETRHNKVYNTAYIFNRQGDCIAHYSKMHGFTPAKEDTFFTGGQDISYFELDGMRCSMVICYDIRFPELVRMSALQGIDILFVASQWPTIRLRHWQILNAARAIENQMYVCAVNGCGTIGRIQCAGHSLVIDPWGQNILEMNEVEGIGQAHIDLTVVQDIRQKINVYQDRKPELYHL